MIVTMNRNSPEMVTLRGKREDFELLHAELTALVGSMQSHGYDRAYVSVHVDGWQQPGEKR